MLRWLDWSDLIEDTWLEWLDWRYSIGVTWLKMLDWSDLIEDSWLEWLDWRCSIELVVVLKWWRGTNLQNISFKCFWHVFESPPKRIIYDNSCKLHQFILNREPSHFKVTFCFHRCGDVGCSSDYSLDKYFTHDITSINSQVNERGNAGLQRIKGQIAYMKQSSSSKIWGPKWSNYELSYFHPIMDGS